MIPKIIRFVALVLGVLSCFLDIQAQVRMAKASQVSPEGYRLGADGKYFAETNADEFWKSGLWKEDTNGLRVILYLTDGNTATPRVSIAVGSRLINSGGGYFKAPNGRFLKFQLIDTNNMFIEPKMGESMEYQFPLRMPAKDFPKWPDGGIKNLFGFFSNSVPISLSDIQIQDVYKIKEEGDYTLTVCPVIFKLETNADYLDRIDLPCVTTNIHLMPSAEHQ